MANILLYDVTVCQDAALGSTSNLCTDPLPSANCCCWSIPRWFWWNIL